MTMNDHDAHQNNNTAKANSLVEQLRRDSQDPSETWTERFRKLAQAIEEASEIELSCEECRSLFDVYIDQELQGQDAALHYPMVWQHLESCTACHTDFETIVSLLREERRAPAPLTPEAHERLQSLPFLRRESVAQGWYTRVRSQLAGALSGFEIRLSLDFLRNALSSSSRLEPGTVTRSIANPLALPDTDTQPLLIDLVSFQDQLINVQLEAEHDLNTERIALHAILAGKRALPQNLWMQLHWAGRIYDQLVTLTEDDQEGHVRIDKIPLADLNKAADEHVRFQINFEVRSP